MTKKNIISQHDKFAKDSLQNKLIAQDFFKAHLPQNVQQLINWKTLELQSGSFIDEDYRDKYTDILYRVDIANQAGYLFILTEHQTSPDKLMPFRLLNYLCKIWERHVKQTPQAEKKNQAQEDLLPLIYPITLYHGKVSPYPHSMHLIDLFKQKWLAREILLNPFPLVDLTAIHDVELARHGYAAVMEMIQKYVFQRDIMPAIEKLAELGLFQLIEQLDDGNYVIKVVDYALNKGDMASPEKLLETIIQALPEQEEGIMTGIEMLKSTARKEGKQLGIEQGRQEATQQRNYEIAKNMLSEGIDSSLVTKTTGISPDVLVKLKKEINA